MNVDFSSVHNDYERRVFEAVLQRASDYPYLDAEALPDVACVALNRMGSRYIRHAVAEFLLLDASASNRSARFLEPVAVDDARAGHVDRSSH